MDAIAYTLPRCNTAPMYPVGTLLFSTVQFSAYRPGRHM